MGGNNSFGKLMFVLGLVLLALLTIFFFSWAKLIWLVLFVILGLLCWRWSGALFWYFLANTVVSLAWAVSLGAMNTQSLLIYLVGLVSAAGLVSSAASMGGNKKVKRKTPSPAQKESPKKVAQQSVSKKTSSRKSNAKKSSRKTAKKTAKKKASRKKTSKKK